MRDGYGENLYWYRGPAKSNSELVLIAIKSWYDEIKDYDYNLPLFDSNTGKGKTAIQERTSIKSSIFSNS